MSSPPLQGAPAPPVKRRSKVRTFFGVALIVCALGGLGLTALFGWEVYGNPPSDPNKAYPATTWRNEPVTKLFPEKLDAQGSSIASKDRVMKWVRAAISPDTRCEAGLDSRALKEVQKFDCKAVLRATYIDATNTQVATIALIVLGDTQVRDELRPIDHVERAIENLDFGGPYGNDPPSFSIRALAAPGTPAARWNDTARNGTFATATLPIYTVAATVGTTDGRRAARLPAPWNDMGLTAATRGDRATYVEGAQGIAQSYSGWLYGLPLDGGD